jgi:hypothetical protein
MKIGVTGHQNIPQQIIPYVTGGILNVVSKVKNLIGFSSLAAGADQIFASIVLEQGGHLHVIVPCEGYETTFSKREDLDRYKSLLSKADIVDTLNYSEPSEDAYLTAGHRIVDSIDLLIAVWDRKPAKGKGGTGDIVQYGRHRGIDVKVIWPSGVDR